MSSNRAEAFAFKTLFYCLQEESKVTDITLGCLDKEEKPYTRPCIRLDGTKIYKDNTEIESAQVSYYKYESGQIGEPPDKKIAQALGNGIFEVDYQPPEVPGAYSVVVSGDGAVKVQIVLPASIDQACNENCRIKESMLSVADDATQHRSTFSVSFVPVYVVDIAGVPDKITVMVDDQGHATSDTRIDYTIQPVHYQAVTANVFIYKDGILDTYIPTETKGQGFGIISRGYEFDEDKTYEAEVVLNFNTGIEIKSKRIPIRFESLAVKKSDPINFPDTLLRWNDYYPKLSAKTITIMGKDDQGQPITSGRIQAEVIFPDNGNPFFNHIRLISIENGTFNNGEAKIQLNAPDLAPMSLGDPQSGIDQVEIRFTYISALGETKGSILETWNIKNNSNTKLGEVLDGFAVFVFDDKSELNHIGKTLYYVTEDRERHFDFVQELLNQVVPRKRSLPLFYDMVEENGIFDNAPDNSTVSAVYYLKEHFNIDNTSNIQWDFHKLMKDYNIPETAYNSWYSKIVDKRLLVGNEQRITDNWINPSITQGDTGLLELYENVVKRFNDLMILAAERYAGLRGAPVPTDLWVSRTGEGPVTSAKPHGKGMGYCYGCKNTVEAFNDTVANCRAESGVTISAREQGPDENNKYRGNINYYNCNLGQGEYDWNGLYRDEYRSGVTPYNPIYWAGIDCSGLVQRTSESAWEAVDNIINLLNPARNSCQFFFSNGICNRNNYTPVITDDPSGFTYLFGPGDGKTPNPLEKIRKGDLVSYAGHITIVYSEKWGISQHNGNYDVIQAFGWECQKATAFCASNPWFRKVGITANNHVGLSIPIGFGRIKLWQ